MPYPLSLRLGAVALCLLVLPWSGTAAQDELPEFLPFRTIAGEGSITVAGGDVYYRLGFDADFRLNPQSNGIHLGDDLHIVTSLAYPVPTAQDLTHHRLVVRLSVDGLCFEPRGRALLFRAPDGGAIAACTETLLQIFDAAGNKVLEDEGGAWLRSATIELIKVGGKGRWKLRSVARFSDPGFPFPVAGFTYDPARGNLVSGVTVIVGGDGGLSPFHTVGFRTLAP